jgi:hypothetical protein
MAVTDNQCPSDCAGYDVGLAADVQWLRSPGGDDAADCRVACQLARGLAADRTKVFELTRLSRLPAQGLECHCHVEVWTPARDFRRLGGIQPVPAYLGHGVGPTLSRASAVLGISAAGLCVQDAPQRGEDRFS